MEGRIKFLIAQQLEKKIEDIHSYDSIEYDLHADSLDMVAIVCAVEEEFGIEIADEEAVNLFTVADVVKYVNDYNAA